jgi:hypothetical protein
MIWSDMTFRHAVMFKNVFSKSVHQEHLLGQHANIHQSDRQVIDFLKP